MSIRGDAFFLLNIVDALKDIAEYTSDGKAAFLVEKMRRDAIERKFEILGEAVKNLSSDFISKHPDVPWSHMARFRDLLAHHYFGIDLNAVWEISQGDVASALSIIRAMPEYLSARADYEKTLQTRQPAVDRLRVLKAQIGSVMRRFGVDSFKLTQESAEQKEEQDIEIDFIVQFQESKPLFTIVELQNELTCLIGCKVSILTTGCELVKSNPQILTNAVEL